MHVYGMIADFWLQGSSAWVLRRCPRSLVIQGGRARSSWVSKHQVGSIKSLGHASMAVPGKTVLDAASDCAE